MKDLLSKTKKVLLGGTVLSILAGFIVLVPSTKATAISQITLSGTNITAHAAPAGSVLGSSETPFVITFDTETPLVRDGQEIQINLHGIHVAADQSLDVADVTLDGCLSSNKLESSNGSNNNGFHEVAIKQGRLINPSTTLVITLDTAAGTLNCPAGRYALSVASAPPQLMASTQAGNYEVSITTSADTGAVVFYSGSTNTSYERTNVYSTSRFRTASF
jgi:phosphohistidine swiveling domain-containing protein